MAWESWVQSQVKSYQKMVLDASLVNTQHYKIYIKGKWSNPENGVAPSPTPWCSSYWKEPLGHPWWELANLKAIIIKC